MRTKPARVTVWLSFASAAATRYTWTSGPFEVVKPVRRSTRRPPARRYTVAAPSVRCEPEWNTPRRSTSVAPLMDSFALMDVVTAAGACAVARLSWTFWFTNRRSGRNRYQPPTSATIATAPIQSLRLLMTLPPVFMGFVVAVNSAVAVHEWRTSVKGSRDDDAVARRRRVSQNTHGWFIG